MVVENLHEEFRLCEDLWLYFNSMKSFLLTAVTDIRYTLTSVSCLLWHGRCTLELLIRTSARQSYSGARPKVRRYSSFYYSVLVATTLYTFSTLFTVRSRAVITFVGGCQANFVYNVNKLIPLFLFTSLSRLTTDDDSS